MTARILAPCYLEHVLDFGQTGHDPVEVLCIVDADGQADDGTVVLHLTGVHGVDGDADVSQCGQHIGQQGLEAISRGALYAVFIENNRKAAKCIEDNIAFTKFTKESRLLTTDVISGISSLEGKYTFDIIFMDPPYRQGLEEDVLRFLSKSSVLKPDTMIIVEASLDTDFSYLDELGFSVIKFKKYKTNMHVFIQQKRV